MMSLRAPARVRRSCDGKQSRRVILTLLLVILSACGGTGDLAEDPAPPAPASSPTAELAARLRALADDSGLVVLARTGTITARFETDARGAELIYSTIPLRVEQTYRGTAPQPLRIKTVGGEVDGLRLAVSHQAEFTAGERTVLFLRRDPTTGFWQVTGGDRGKLPVLPGDRVRIGNRLLSLTALENLLR